MPQKNSYWNGNGYYQEYADIYTEMQVTKDKPHLILLGIVSRMYYDFHNNGNNTWYKFINNGLPVNLEYTPPKDAPYEIKDEFKNMREEYEVYEEYVKKNDNYDYDSSDDDDEDNVPYVTEFDHDKLEDMMDRTLFYVHQKQEKLAEKKTKTVAKDKKTETKDKKLQSKPVEKKKVIDAENCKILNPDTGKYVDLRGQTALKVLKKYAPGMFK